MNRNLLACSIRGSDTQHGGQHLEPLVRLVSSANICGTTLYFLSFFILCRARMRILQIPKSSVFFINLIFISVKTSHASASAFYFEEYTRTRVQLSEITCWAWSLGFDLCTKNFFFPSTRHPSEDTLKFCFLGLGMDTVLPNSLPLYNKDDFYFTSQYLGSS